MDGLLFLSDIFLLLALAAWAGSLAFRPRRLLSGPLFLTVPLTGLVLLGFTSSFFSLDPLLSLYSALRLAFLLALYFFLVNEVSSFTWIVWSVAGQALLQAVVGIAQAARQHSLGWQALGEYELDPAWNGVSIVLADGLRLLRAYGLSDHPNILGGCLAFALLMVFVWYLGDKTKGAVLWAAAFMTGALALLLTFSRSAWMAMLAGLLFIGFILLRERKTAQLANAGFLLSAGMIILAPFLWANAAALGVRLNGSDSFSQIKVENRSLDERAMLNAAAGEIFSSHALTGVGLGAAPLALLEARPDFPFNFQPPHNALLEAAEETGIFGAAFYFLLLVLPWLALWLSRHTRTFSPELLMSSASLLAVTVVGFFDYYPWLLAPGRFWQWLVWGLWAGAYSSASKGENVIHG